MKPKSNNLKSNSKKSTSKNLSSKNLTSKKSINFKSTKLNNKNLKSDSKKLKTNSKTNISKSNTSKNKSSTIKLIFLLIMLFLMMVSLTAAIYLNFMIEDVITVPYNFGVEGKIAGLDAGTDQLGFGTLPLGGVSERAIHLTSDKNAQVLLTAIGDGSEWIKSRNGFYIEAGDTERVNITVSVPDDIEERRYEGKITILFLRDMR